MTNSSPVPQMKAEPCIIKLGCLFALSAQICWKPHAKANLLAGGVGDTSVGESIHHRTRNATSTSTRESHQP